MELVFSMADGVVTCNMATAKKPRDIYTAVSLSGTPPSPQTAKYFYLRQSKGHRSASFVARSLKARHLLYLPHNQLVVSPMARRMAQRVQAMDKKWRKTINKSPL